MRSNLKMYEFLEKLPNLKNIWDLTSKYMRPNLKIYKFHKKPA